MENSNPKNPAIEEMLGRFGQWFAVVMLFIEKLLSLNLSVEQVQKLLKDREHPFWLAFNEATKLLVSPAISLDGHPKIDDDTARQIGFWGRFYKEHFNIDLDLSGVKIPERRNGFGWLVIIAKGVSLNQVWEVCRKHFKCWKNTKSDLESMMQESERGPAKATTVFWFRDCIEADKENQNVSAMQLTESSITLIARCLLELKYFSETKKHLDIENVTLCAGSRYHDSSVPGADWDGDVFCVYWYYVDDADLMVRSRVAVTL